MATYLEARPRPRRRVRRVQMTLQEYLATPESPLPHELAYGVLRVADAPTPFHQRAVARLFRALDPHVETQALGEMWLSPVDVILDAERHLVVQPDLLFISSARSRIVADRIRGAPDLVIEVLSPHLRIGTHNEHLQWFATYGVRECWAVDLVKRSLDVIAFGDGRVVDRQRFDEYALIRSRVLPDFSATLIGIVGL